MPLTDAQIARYSRQIIVEGIGGHAQERLLSSRIVMIGTRDDIERPLAYLVGAGVGDIDLCVPGKARDLRSLCDKMRDLNPDSTVSYGSLAQSPDLVLALIGSRAIVEFVAQEAPNTGAAVVARLDTPGKIALLPSPPPCIRCSRGNLLGPFGARTDSAEFISMLATTETLKLLSAFEPAVSASLINFDGFHTSIENLQLSSKSNCDCSNT